MKFKHLLLLSLFFASLLIGALLLISKPVAPEKTIVLTESTAHLYILPARHIPNSQTITHHHL